MIRHSAGNGFWKRAYHEKHELTMAILKRHYNDGKQYAFQYWDDPETTREGLRRLGREMEIPWLRDLPPIYGRRSWREAD